MRYRMDFSQFSQSPKSTIVGLCVLALAAERGVHFDAAGHLLMSARDWFDVGCGVLTALVAGISQDAGRVKAMLPGADAPEMVAGHEVPDTAGAVPVVDERQ